MNEKGRSCLHLFTRSLKSLQGDVSKSGRFCLHVFTKPLFRKNRVDFCRFEEENPSKLPRITRIS